MYDELKHYFQQAGTDRSNINLTRSNILLKKEPIVQKLAFIGKEFIQRYAYLMLKLIDLVKSSGKETHVYITQILYLSNIEKISKSIIFFEI